MKKKQLIIVGSIIGALALAVSVLLLVLRQGTTLTSEQLAWFREMADTRSGAISDYIQIIPASEVEYFPVDGIDYISADIAKAFTEFYDAARDDNQSGVTVVNNNNAVYDGGNSPIVITQPQAASDSDRPKPQIYTGGIDVRHIAPLKPEPEDLSDPVAWVDFGEKVMDYIAGQYVSTGDDEEFYERLDNWSDPENWEEMGVGLLEMMGERSDGGDFDYELWDQVVVETITGFVEIGFGDIVDISDIDEMLTEVVEEEWGQFDDTQPMAADNTIPSAQPGESGYTIEPGDYGYEPPKADTFEINYKAAGRQFYREALSRKQQLVYDILASCIQRGEFEVNCDFGITIAEAATTVHALLYDHPEFFFIDGFAHGTAYRHAGGFEYDPDAALGYVGFSLDDEIMQIGVDKALADITAKAKPIIAKGKQIVSQIDRVKYIADALCEISHYTAGSVLECKYSQNIYSGIVTGETVCAGYARGFQYLAAFLGIDAAYAVSVNNERGVGHAWNLVQIDGDYYYTDVTWMDNDVGGEILPGFERLKYELLAFNEQGIIKLVIYGMVLDDGVLKAMPETGTIKEASTPYLDDCHKVNFVSELLPSAEGTKYSYLTWYRFYEAKLSQSDTPAETPSKPEPTSDSAVPDDTRADAEKNGNEIATDNYTPPPYVPDSDEPSNEPEPTQEPTPEPDEIPVVLVNGADVSGQLQIEEIDDVWYAEGESFLESFGYYYDYTTDDDRLFDLLKNYDPETGGYWVDEGTKRFLDYDCVFVRWGPADVVWFILMLDTNEVWFCDEINAGDAYYLLTEMREAPVYVDGEVYIPMEDFARLTGQNLEIR